MCRSIISQEQELRHRAQEIKDIIYTAAEKEQGDRW